jgi:hypothetical protein
MECRTRQATLLQYAETADRRIGSSDGAVTRETTEARHESEQALSKSAPRREEKTRVEALVSGNIRQDCTCRKGNLIE